MSEGELPDIASHVSRGASTTISPAPSAKLESAKQPVESEFLNVVLGNLEEARLDLHLAGGSGQGDLHKGVDQIKIGLRVLDQKLAAGGEIGGAGTEGEGDSLGFQKFLGSRLADRSG